jgi:asparagine synthase (glutamine-hydrolysing)
MRFADRNSMTYSLELREPFLDYRLVELGLRQLTERKIKNGEGKYLIRKLSSQLIPKGVFEAPKRPLQTPQREGLASDLQPWVRDLFVKKNEELSDFFKLNESQNLYNHYCKNKPDNSFGIWQLINFYLLKN